MVPFGLEDQIKWPDGTTHLQCGRSPGGHMMLVMSHWNRFEGEKTMRKQKEILAQA